MAYWHQGHMQRSRNKTNQRRNQETMSVPVGIRSQDMLVLVTGWDGASVSFYTRGSIFDADSA
eukprot:3521395-Prorocentrum_lima.AAC.1